MKRAMYQKQYTANKMCENITYQVMRFIKYNDTSIQIYRVLSSNLHVLNMSKDEERRKNL
jgi:hypothetical protein